MRIIETKVYTIDEHPNKELCFEWIRDNWHDLNQQTIDEVIASIEALSQKIGGTFNYSISQTPDRDEHITFTNYDKDALRELDADNCPLTGCCYDINVIEGLRTNTMSNVLDAIHNETEFVYSDDGLNELCEANEYEFTEGGNII